MERDCAAGDFVCPEGTACVKDQTSGNGGCDYQYSIDVVGVCKPL